MPAFVTPTFWLLLFFFCIYRFRFFETVGIKKEWIYAAFAFRVLAGFANYYIWLHVIGHGDSLRYIHDSRIVYDVLWQHPSYYFELLTRTSIQNVPEHLLPYQHSLFIEWHVPEYNMVRLYAILNVFSFGNAWGNIVILSWLSFVALIALFKALSKLFTASPNKLLFAILFFLPSVVFWSNGLLKEEPTLILLCILFLQLIHLESGFAITRILFIVITLLLLFLVRDYLLWLLLPNILIWGIALRYKTRAFRIFIVSTLLIALGVIALDQFTSLEIGQWLQHQQSYFLLSNPDPDYSFQTLPTSLQALPKEVPYTLNNIFLRPNLLQSSSAFRLYQSLELLLCWLFLLRCLILRNRRRPLQPTELAFLFICSELLLVYGLLVTDADTLSRYRSIPLFFLLVIGTLQLRNSKSANNLVKNPID